MLVVVHDILLQDCPQAPESGDQHPVGALGPDGPYPALGTGVRSRAARRTLHHLDPGTRQYWVERVGELPGPVTEAEQLTLDPLVPPARVVPRHLQRQRPHGRRGPGPSRVPARIRPAPP